MLGNGNLVIASNNWSGTFGAVTWMNGATGLLSDGSIGGAVTAANSLVGSVVGDRVGNERALLANGNVVMSTSLWNGSRGAMTWMNGATGQLSDGSTGGAVSTLNSLVGSTAGDKVGTSTTTWFSDYNGWTLLGNGNLLIASNNWNNGGVAAGAGAVSWMNGATGRLSDGSTGGAVSSLNSLLGSTAGDKVGSTITTLANNNAVVITLNWTQPAGAGPALASAGAVTWMDGASGKLSDLSSGGAVSSVNSLVGGAAGDRVGSWGITQVSDASTTFLNYLVSSPEWGGAGGVNTGLGAVTWMSGTTGRLSTLAAGGTVSAANSLVGSTAGDRVSLGYGFWQLSNGNVLVRSAYWSNGVTAAGAGALTWMNGVTGALSDATLGGAISASNSLIGGTAGDNVGSAGITQLGNGKLVIASPYWNNGAATRAGAVTWMDSATGKLSDNSTGGLVTATNSLVGSTANDIVGSDGVTQVTDNLSFWNYVVRSSAWSGTAGAITWVNGNTGKTFDGLGTISSANSLVGSAVGDYVGSGWNSVLALGNGKAVFASSSWNGGRGAVSWMDGATGKLADGTQGGFVSATNSLVGSTATLSVAPYTPGDQLGSGGLTEITDYSTFWNYAVLSPNWTNGTAAGAGAVTFGNGATGTVGVVSGSNSLVGSAAGDRVGSGGITLVSDGATFWNYVVSSPDWGGAGGYLTGMGAVTWVNGATGKLSNGAAGGAVASSNSLTGSAMGDQVGVAPGPSWSSTLTGINVFSNGNMLIRSQHWGGEFSALTWMNGKTGALADGATGGVVSPTNSLLGSAAYDDLGGGMVGLTELQVNGNWVITSPGWGSGGANWSGGIGAATWMNSSTGQLADGSFGGVVSASNSLVGSIVGDIVGGDYACDCSYTGGITALSDGNYVVNSLWWGTPDIGAVTWGNGTGGTVGIVSSSNSVFALVNNVTELASQPGKVLIGSGTANGGAGGVYLLGGMMNGSLFADSPGVDATIGAGNIAATLNLGTNVVLQANNDIMQLAGAAITATGSGNLSLQAGRSVILEDVINIAGALNITANDAGAIATNRTAGTAVIDTTMATITAGMINLSNSGGDILAGAMTANTFTLSSGTWNQVSATLPGFTVNDFRIAGGTFIRALSGDGSVATPYQVTDIFGVQGMGSAGMLGKSYVLASNVDASGTSNWNAGAGFMSIGDVTTGFSGSFDGQNNTISNLYIYRPTIGAGLFGYTAAAGIVRNVGIVGGNVTGGDWGVGELVGFSYGTIANSYSTGTVNGAHDVGGLVGDNYGTISNSYSTASVTSSANGLGGLVGANYNSIDNSYSTGAVSGGTFFVGGLVGYSTGTVSNSYWDTQTSGQATSYGGTGITTAQMKNLSSFTGWNIANTGSAGTTWRIYEGSTAPLLSSFLKPLSVTANNASKTYDGVAYSGGNGVSYSVAGAGASLFGTPVYGGTSQGAVNAGSYTISVSGLYSNQQGYDTSYVNGTLAINSAVTAPVATTPVTITTAVNTLTNMVVMAAADTTTSTSSEEKKKAMEGVAAAEAVTLVDNIPETQPMTVCP